MGKSPEAKRLVILVDDEWYDHPRIAELREKGHSVGVWGMKPHAKPDLVLSTASWNWNESMWPMLDTAIKSARKEKAGKKK